MTYALNYLYPVLDRFRLHDERVEKMLWAGLAQARQQQIEHQANELQELHKPKTRKGSKVEQAIALKLRRNYLL